MQLSNQPNAESSQPRSAFPEPQEQQSQALQNPFQLPLSLNSPPPPVPYQQFEYSFPPAFPDQLLPVGDNATTKDLFSASEQDNILGFLDKFEWQFDPLLPSGIPSFNAGQLPGGSTDLRRSLRSPPLNSSTEHISPAAHAVSTPRAHSPTNPSRPSKSQLSSPVYTSAPPQTYPGPSSGHFSPTDPHSAASGHSALNTPYNEPSRSQTDHASVVTLALKQEIQEPSVNLLHEGPDDGQKGPRDQVLTGSIGEHPSSIPAHSANGRPQKPVLSTPEKRVRHILSEQRRRNTIRDGYAALTNMLVPYPNAALRPAPPRPPRGKGKGTRGRTRGKGKSGVLFRAVEYIKWLDECVEDLTEEVNNLEVAVRDYQNQHQQSQQPPQHHPFPPQSHQPHQPRQQHLPPHLERHSRHLSFPNSQQHRGAYHS